MNKNNSKSLPKSLITSYLRAKVISEICSPRVPIAVIIHENGHFKIISAPWGKYWNHVPSIYQKPLNELKFHWEEYILSNFDKNKAKKYCDAYLILLKLCYKQGYKSSSFRRKLLSFENFGISYNRAKTPCAAITTNFRNPILLKSKIEKAEKLKGSKQNLLPVILVNNSNNSTLFCSYRKNRMIKNSDSIFLFYLNLNLDSRKKSFQAMQFLADNFIEGEWSARIEERSSLLFKKVLIPLLNLDFILENNLLSICDVGSGTGLFTKAILKKIKKEFNMSFNLTSVDIIHATPERNLITKAIKNSLKNSVYFSMNYHQWFDYLDDKKSITYDILFLFKILDHKSEYHFVESINEPLDYQRYYYNVLSKEFAKTNKYKNVQEKNFKPKKYFNANALMSNKGKSIIDIGIKKAKWIIIEDWDLMQDDIKRHIYDNKLEDIAIYDLSSKCRLRKNHIYVIGRKGVKSPFDECKL